MKKENKGITLIALVITIIVLLILAGVTIQTLTWDNGLLQKAQTAKEENEETKELELIKLAVSAAQIEGKGNLITDNIKNELKEKFDDYESLEEKHNCWFYNNYRIDENGEVEKNEEYVSKNGIVYHKFEIYEGKNSPGYKYQNCDKMITIEMPNFEMSFPFDWTEKMFSGCTCLKSIIMPVVQSAGHYLFTEIPSLEYLELGSIGHPWQGGGYFMSSQYEGGYNSGNFGTPVGLTIVAYMDSYNAGARIFSWCTSN